MRRNLTNTLVSGLHFVVEHSFPCITFGRLRALLRESFNEETASASRAKRYGGNVKILVQQRTKFELFVLKIKTTSSSSEHLLFPPGIIDLMIK